MSTNDTPDLQRFGTTDEPTDELDVTQTPAWPEPDEDCGCTDELQCYEHFERERALREEH